MGKRLRRPRVPGFYQPSRDVVRFEWHLNPRLAALCRERGLSDDYTLSRAEWDGLLAATADELYGGLTPDARRTIARLEASLARQGVVPCRPSEAVV